MVKKFEYKEIYSSKLDSKLMQQLGQEGWEMAGVVAGRDGCGGMVYFKREIESPVTHKQEQNGYDMSR